MHTGLAISSNVWVYDRIGVFYATFVGLVSGSVRDQVTAVERGPENRSLVVVVWRGLDLPHLPQSVRGMAIDLSDSMLRYAWERRTRLGMRRVELEKMDDQALNCRM